MNTQIRAVHTPLTFPTMEDSFNLFNNASTSDYYRHNNVTAAELAYKSINLNMLIFHLNADNVYQLIFIAVGATLTNIM